MDSAEIVDNVDGEDGKEEEDKFTPEQRARKERFERIKSTIPEVGALLGPLPGGDLARVFEDTRRVNGEERPVLFCCLTIDPQATSWFIGNGPKGLKAIIVEEDHSRVLVNDSGKLFVKQLKVVRQSKKKTSVICRVWDHFDSYEEEETSIEVNENED